MNKQERIINRKFGKKAQFKVPERYFEDFTHTLMNKLPERVICIKPVKTATFYRLRFATMVAASTITAILCLDTLLHKPGNTTSSQHLSATTESRMPDNSINEIADYAMFDNEQIDDYIAYN